MRNIWLMLLPLLALLSSCHSREKIVYLQGASEQGLYVPQRPYEARIAKDNQLSILVTCSDLELAVPFNLHRPQPSIQQGGGNYSSNYQDTENLCYRVDSRGNITFPTMGQLHVEGMTRTELSDTLASYLRNNGFIQDPIVNVSFNGIHYSVLGEVNRPGTYPMQQERVTVLEALAQAGDMTVFGERDKVRLVRNEADGEHVVTINLKDPQLLAGPYYYMHDGDVLYVEPSGTRAANREVSSLSNFAISITSIALTLASLIIAIVK